MTEREEALARASAEFREALAEVRLHLDRVRATPVHTREERAELEADARSGRLGPEMRELARHIDAGETSWGEVFEGGSPYSSLLAPHVTAMEQRYAEQWRAAIRSDPDFAELADPDPDRGRPDLGVPDAGPAAP